MGLIWILDLFGSAFEQRPRWCRKRVRLLVAWGIRLYISSAVMKVHYVPCTWGSILSLQRRLRVAVLCCTCTAVRVQVQVTDMPKCAVGTWIDEAGAHWRLRLTSKEDPRMVEHRRTCQQQEQQQYHSNDTIL
ncbi:hypothetical protein BDW69DRAFT_179103 [Aspergillus filifer]